MEAGQVVRDRQMMPVPGGLAPGAYNISVGRQREDDPRLPVRRGPVPLGTTYPLATVRVLGRATDLTPPTVANPVDAKFGDGIRFAGYDFVITPNPGSVMPSRTTTLRSNNASRNDSWANGEPQ